MAAGFASTFGFSRRPSDSRCRSRRTETHDRRVGYSTSWWRLVPAVLIAVGAIAVLPATAGAADGSPVDVEQRHPGLGQSGRPLQRLHDQRLDRRRIAALRRGGQHRHLPERDLDLERDRLDRGQLRPPAPRPGSTPLWPAPRAGPPTVRSSSAGSTAPTTSADTWTWDGTTWTQQSPATSPPARAGATMEYFDGQVVLFGGYNGTSYLNDTWTWDGTTWTEDTGTEPSGAGLCLDGRGHRLRRGHRRSGALRRLQRHQLPR